MTRHPFCRRVCMRDGAACKPEHCDIREAESTPCTVPDCLCEKEHAPCPAGRCSLTPACLPGRQCVRSA